MFDWGTFASLMDPPGIEPGASPVRGVRSTDELRAREKKALETV